MKKTFPVPQAFEQGPAPFIKMHPVESRQIRAVGFDPATRTLAVAFNYGKALYHYPDVEAATHEGFMAAESKGTFFGKHIKALPFKKYAVDPVPA